MFDDLHDPNPPTAGMDALASVATRARQLRRRRSLALSGAGVAVVALAVAAFVLPGRDRASVAPADSVPVSLPVSSPFGEGPVPQCGVLTDPVWMPNGELPGTPETISGIDPFTGDRVDGRVWSSPEGYGLLVQLPATAEVLQLPSSGQMWDLRVRDARPAVDSVEVTIWRRAGNCAARYLVPGDVEAATAWGTAFVDQLTVTAAGITLVEDPEHVYCPAVDDVTRSDACIGFEPKGDAEGASSRGFVIPADGFSSPLLGPVGVVFLLIPADADVTPRSRLASEQVLGDGRWKAFLDIVPADDQRCFEITGGETSFRIGVVLTVDGGDSCPGEPSGSGSTATDPTTTTTTALVTTVAPTIADPVPAGERPVVAIDGNGDAVVFDDDLVPTVVFAGTDPDDPPAAEGPTTYVDGLAASADGSTVAVGVCCEPSAGALWRPDPGGGDGTFLNYGHLPALTSYGNLVWYAFGPVNIGGVDGSIATTLLELDPSEWTVKDLAVVQRGTEPEEVLVLASRSDGTYLWRVFVGGGDMQLSVRISTAVGADAGLSLAGFGDDQFLVLNRRSGSIERYGAQNLQPIPTEADPVDWISAWITPDGTRHVDADGVLWVDGTSRGGDYRWVR